MAQPLGEESVENHGNSSHSENGTSASVMTSLLSTSELAP
jgi:hypothetical protein